MRLGSGAEFDLIRRFLATPAAAADGAPGVRVGPGDDCAVITGDGIALTVDMAVEDVHFRRSWLEPREIGYRAAAGALSDLAAMAARPVGILASLALGPGDEDELGPAVMEGVAAAASDAGAVLLGGDVTRSPGPLVLDIVAAGQAARPVLRSGARPGDELWVTGTLGGAAAAVAAWIDGREPEPAARTAFARPTPRIREALWLAEREVPTAMVDLSDGVAGDAGHIAAASDVRVVIHGPALPLGPGLAPGATANAGARSAAGGVTGAGSASSAASLEVLRLAAAGGEDYELCFSASPGSVAAVAAEFEVVFGVPLTRVGRVEPGSGAVVLDATGSAVELEGFQHWRAR